MGDLPCVANKESHLRRSDGVSGNDEIAFIFAVLGIEHDDEFAVLWCIGVLVSYMDVVCMCNECGGMDLPPAPARVGSSGAGGLTKGRYCVLNRVELKGWIQRGMHVGWYFRVGCLV